jgi:hypothetical protein
MRPIKLAAAASKWLRQPALTTSDVPAFGTGSRRGYGARRGVAHTSPD